MKLGTAVWNEGGSGHVALVAELPSDPGRVVDLNRLEHLRLAKLGEGWAERMADATVPGGLRQLLEGGPRAIHRARKVLAYAEKWHKRGTLPETMAPWADSVRMLACLPNPLAVRRWDGSSLDPLAVQGPTATLASLPAPTLALVGLYGEPPAGCCLALEHADGVVLGAWLELDLDWEGALELDLGGEHRSMPLDAWRGLVLPALRPAEVLLAPPPHLRLGPGAPGMAIRLVSAFETLSLRLAEDEVHATVQ
ncbi:MAG: hypothetical protein P4L36_19990 [Holophaga sp.]|nr:hypothetical protein [Holophaga sp.]